AAPGRRSPLSSRPICGPMSPKAPASTTRASRPGCPEQTRSASVRVDEVEAVVIGAGVIGLAAARALALAGHEVIVLERAYTIGFETSSRNSEVIHGGLYYPKGSLKARSCVEGRERLYAYCQEHGVPHARLGKLIVATSEEEIPGVEKIDASARANGVDNLEWLSASEAQRMEPELHCVAALLSPSTGIIDSHALMLAYQGEAEAAGAFVAFRTPVFGGHVRGDGFELSVGGDEATAIRCRYVVNAAGLYAPAVARTIEGVPREGVLPPVAACSGHQPTAAPGSSIFTRTSRPPWTQPGRSPTRSCASSAAKELRNCGRSATGSAAKSELRESSCGRRQLGRAN